MEDRFKYEVELFGQRIRKLRKLKNLTQIDLEEIAKIDHGDISRIENGKKNMEFFTIVKLAEAFDLGLKDLFDDPADKL